MTPELKAQLGQLLADARDDESVGKKSELLDRYLAEPYGDEVDGRSKFVDASVSDAVDALLPDIMDVFTSAEDILEFEAVGPEDEDAAKQETQAVSHIFWQKNRGFEVLLTWLKESMIQQNAYVWRGWVEKRRVEIEEYEDLTPEEFMTVMSDIDGDYRFLSKEGFSVGDDDELILEAEAVSFKVRIESVSKEYLVEPFPQEDFFITPRWSKLSLDGVPCCGRKHRDKTREDWVAYGFSEESLSRLSEGSEDEEKAARHHTRDVSESESQTDLVALYEAYVMLDPDDKGQRLHRVWCNEDGTHIMQWKDGKEAVEEVSDVPIHAVTPYVMPHRHTGRSVSENVDDIARVKTVLMRHALDNIYYTNFPRPMYDENSAGENLEADLSQGGPGAPIRTGGAEVMWTQPQGMLGDILPLIGKFDDLQEMRVGATRYNQGLDANSLNKTASGITQIMNASQKKAKMIARTFAETGLRDVFLGIHRDLRAGPLKDLVMKLRGQWVAVNPRTWKHRTDMVVNVGMGRGDRDERRAGYMMAGQVQRELVAAGSRMVDEEKLFNTFDAVLGTFGINGIERYFNDPRTLPPPQPQPERPDPIMISAQGQVQKQIADAQRDAAKLQADERERQRQYEIRMAELRIKEAELMNRIQDDQDKLRLQQQKTVMDDDFKRDKLEIDALTGLHREEAKRVQSEPPVSYSEVEGDTR